VHDLKTLRDKATSAFDQAAKEKKIETRGELLDRLSQPLVIPKLPNLSVPKTSSPAVVMRKNMTSIIDELLASNQSCVYLGEDVVQGGSVIVSSTLKP